MTDTDTVNLLSAQSQQHQHQHGIVANPIPVRDHDAMGRL